MKLAKQHLTKKQGVEALRGKARARNGQALRRAQHLTNPSEEKRTVRDANTVDSLTIIIDNRTTSFRTSPKRRRGEESVE